MTAQKYLKHRSLHLLRPLQDVISTTQTVAAITLTAALLGACSTTRNLPEGEQLYIGIKNINYTGTPERSSRKTALTDSAGVITSIGEGVKAVSDLLNGEGTGALEEVLAPKDTPKQLTREERKALKVQEKENIKAFETAKTEVDAVLAYAPNYAIFGSSSLRSPFPVGLWVYNSFVGSKKKMGKWILKTFGATPVLISTVVPETRSRVATNLLHNYGYFGGRVDYEVLPQKNPRKAKVSYNVYAGPVHRLDSIAYVGFPPRADSLLRATEAQRLLRKGDAFSVVNLSGEQTRIEKLLRENGYYYYSAANTTYRADTVMRKGKVQLEVSPAAGLSGQAKRQWYIGNTFVTVRRSEHDVLDQSLLRRHFIYKYSGRKLPLRAAMWRQAVSHRHGEIFRESDSRSTLEKLGNMGIFSQLDVNYMPHDTTSAGDTLDVYVTAMMDKLYDSSFEMNATMKSNQQVGPGISYSIAKRNAFGGGERVAFKIFGSYEWQTRTSGDRNSLLNSYELGTELSLEFPRLLQPFVRSRRLRFPASTTFTLNADWKNRAGFFQIVTFGLDGTYKWHKNATTRHELTFFSLEFDKLLHKTGTFDSIMTANPALYTSMRDQFVPSLSYSFTYTAAASHRNPLWLQFTAKEAGNVVSGLYAAAGRSFSTRNKDLFGSPFAQFVKVTAEAHETFRLPGNRFKLAARLFAGAIYSYGNSLHAPYADQFYAGGANSIRAFTVRTIGPGAYHSENKKYAYIDQTGDLKLEANLELRARLFGSLHGAVFLDAGNVWLLRDDPARPDGKFSARTLRNIALGTGAGLRYDLDFLVLRLDFGIGLHAPYTTSRKGFYNIERFRDGFAFHFAIGYPF